MDLDALFADPPRFHIDPATDRPVDWALAPDVLRHLDRQLPAAARTAETGAGTSTAFFALRAAGRAGAAHTAIAPDAGLFERIEDWLAVRDVPRAGLKLVAERSEDWLPRGGLEDLDLFLIDGRHGFPAPFVDWFYGVRALKVGGLVAVDDTQLFTGRVLADFLHTDRHWSDGVEIGKTALFRKVDDGVHDDEWGAQELVRGWRLKRPRDLLRLRKLARLVRLLP